MTSYNKKNSKNTHNHINKKSHLFLINNHHHSTNLHPYSLNLSSNPFIADNSVLFINLQLQKINHSHMLSINQLYKPSGSTKEKTPFNNNNLHIVYLIKKMSLKINLIKNQRIYLPKCHQISFKKIHKLLF